MSEKEGKLQYLKNDKGGILRLISAEIKYELNASGDTIRSTLFKQSFIGKIRDVERNKNDKPQRGADGEWIYKKGVDEFLFVERKPIKYAAIQK